ncbi:MAG: TIGR03936 family radical SAM-associated protein [Firmicutes bacterium]|nr:TIGR03936 family radical SAM-associated protein [Bacillota bacterium]
MQTVRIWFQKTGSAKYISHLDLSRCMARALRRAHVPAWYTEGFSPHLFVTFALPLSLGQEGERESMDIRLPEDYPIAQAAEALGKALPPGLCVLKASLPEQKPGDISAARFRMEFSGEDAVQTVRGLLERPELPVVKKTKKGEQQIDLQQWFSKAETGGDAGTVTLRLVLPAGSSESVNPALFAGLALQQSPKLQIRIIRETLLCQTADGLKEFS